MLLLAYGCSLSYGFFYFLLLRLYTGILVFFEFCLFTGLLRDFLTLFAVIIVCETLCLRLLRLYYLFPYFSEDISFTSLVFLVVFSFFRSFGSLLDFVAFPSYSFVTPSVPTLEDLYYSITHEQGRTFLYKKL